jgi:pimeloyl-ACP methyl ester carboxylesterase
LLVAGSIYESSSEAADAKAYPPPGEMVDVGGHRLHINCMGSGEPTVVIEAGWGDWSETWGPVQQDVAKTTRVCTYDRAGMGWSEPGPLPRDAAQIAKELETLLHNANIPGPYVVVGHSLGGLPVRVFAHEYPAEVAGVVLIESMSPRQFSQPAGAAEASQPNPGSHATSLPSDLARAGLVRLLAKPLGIAGYVPQHEGAYYSRFVRPEHIQAYLDEGRGLPASALQARAVTDLGSVPLIVLTSRQNDVPRGWQAMQSELVQLSTNSQQLFAEKSGHNIELEEPEAAVAAIDRMVLQVRASPAAYLTK